MYVLLYRKPVPVPDLVDVLLKFRLMKHAITTDVARALHPLDGNCVRFQWLKNFHDPVVEKNIKCYHFKRVPFGVASSPSLSSATLSYHSKKQGSLIALGIRRIRYVDNIILLSEETEDALKNYWVRKRILSDASKVILGFVSDGKDFY